MVVKWLVNKLAILERNRREAAPVNSTTPTGDCNPAPRDESAIDRLRKEVQGYTWGHTIDLGDGIVTKGVLGPPNSDISRALDAVGLRGKRVLDIGCWDGLWSFEAEKRGAAEVHATDDVSQRWGSHQPTFQLAHRELRSRAYYHPNLSVNRVEELNERDFDLILFCGVYYHLKNPLLAMAKLRRIIKEGGMLIVEGPVMDAYQQPVARFFYRTWLAGDPSNWWVPNLACLREWLECSFFDIVDEKKAEGATHLTEDNTRIERYTLIARAVRRKDRNYPYLDEDLHFCIPT